MTDLNQSDVVSTINELRRMSRVSNSSFLRSFNSTLSESGDLSKSLKRKFPSEYDSDSSAKRDNHGSPLMSPWEFRRLRGDLADAQTQIVRLEDRIDQLHKKNKEAVIFFDTEKAEMKTQLDNSRERIEKLESKIQKMRCKDAEMRENMYDIQRLLEKKVLDKEEKIRELKNDNAQLRLELAELEEHSDRQEMDLKNELEKVKKELMEFQLSSEEAKEQALDAQARLTVALDDCKELESLRIEFQKANDTIKALQLEKDEWEEARTVLTVQQHRVFRLNEIEEELKRSQEEVAQLRMAVTNKVMMEEQVQDLQQKVSSYADLEKQFIALKEQNYDLEVELKQWKKTVQEYCVCETRDELDDYLKDVQENQTKNRFEQSELKAELKEVQFKLKRCEDDLEASRKATEDFKAQMERQKTEIQILRRKLALVSRERDSYRQQLDMFEKDLTVSASTGEAAVQDRVQELEKILQAYREEMETLEKKSALFQTDDTDSRLELIRKLENELQASKAECERLSSRRDELEQMLEDRVRGGTFPSPGTKILHFRNNPSAMAEQQQADEINELRNECDRLKARIRLLAAGENFDLTVRSAADVESGTAARVRELEEQLESANLKNTRLKEVFKRTSQDFRDVSYMLLGYRIDLVSNKTYKLTNMYSDDPEDHFMFQLNRSGMMEMLETPYTTQVSYLIKEHLLENNSIPCFLSAVTLKLHASMEETSSHSEHVTDEEEPEEVVELSD